MDDSGKMLTSRCLATLLSGWRQTGEPIDITRGRVACQPLSNTLSIAFSSAFDRFVDHDRESRLATR